MVDRVGLENRYTRKGIEGSNPSLSAPQDRQSAVFPVSPPSLQGPSNEVQVRPGSGRLARKYSGLPSVAEAQT